MVYDCIDRQSEYVLVESSAAFSNLRVRRRGLEGVVRSNDSSLITKANKQLSFVQDKNVMRDPTRHIVVADRPKLNDDDSNPVPPAHQRATISGSSSR
jgi:hypothetical protein